MKLLFSNSNTLTFHNSQQQMRVWEDLLSISTNVKIATGYISCDSILELKNIVAANPTPNLDLFIGMHYLEKFTRLQYQAVSKLDTLLRTTNRGQVYLSPYQCFHGKLYSFSNADACIGGIIGSSNLGSIMGFSSHLYEVDCLLDTQAECEECRNVVNRIIDSLGKPFSELQIDSSDFKQVEVSLDNHEGVTKIPPNERRQIKETSVYFDLQLKCEPKSNLNAYLGKGREVRQTKYIIPRSWYEVEIIVSKKTTSMKNYPSHRKFTVITCDDWKFECVTNGDNAKNFRSAQDLKILGKWIKEYMFQCGCLELGEPVTDETIRKFGFNHLRLRATTTPDVWLLEFVQI